MSILIQRGHVVDPATGLDEICDVYIEDNKIKKRGKDLKEKAERIIDASGCYVMPGLIDLHVHLRDPGLTYKEDVITGARAAAHGGFTTILAMPNTKPVIDCKSRVNYVHIKAAEEADVNVMQVGAITVGQKGEELADIKGMAEAGSPAVSEDGKSVMNTQLYREGMQLAKEYDLPVLAHCEDITMVRGGCMNQDEKAEKLHLKGIANAVEDVIVARDILLAKDTGVRLHLCHCSTKDSVTMIKAAKEAGLPVTGEVCPHHFTLSTEDIEFDDPNYKMNPPLRTRADVEALRQGLKEDIMDVISTDHAPHSQKEKTGSMADAPFGIVGLETSVPLTISELVEPGILTPMQMAEKMSYNPAQIIKLDKGSLEEGKIADVVVIDPREEYMIDKNKFASKGKNTPFHGRTVRGKVKYTICDGKIVWEDTKHDK